MFRKIAVSVTLAALVSISLWAQDRPLPPAAGSKPETIADYSQEAYVFEKLSNVYQFENDGRGFRRQSGRCRIQSEAALQQLGQLVFGYNSGTERMKINYVRVIRADGSVVNAGETAVQDMTTPVAREAPVYSDLHEKHITVPSLRPGEVLEYEIEVEFQEPLAPGQFWMDHSFEKNVISLNETLELNIPAGRRLTLKTQPGFDPKISEAGSRRIYTWTSNHLAREDSKKKKNEKPKKPSDRADVAASTFASWDELAAWYAGLEKDRRKPTPELTAKAVELSKDRKTEREKAQAIYDYVAKNFRYVSLSFGVGRFQPHPASEIFANQYGDCKDKDTLLAAMLAAVNINADAVLIHSQRKLDRDVPSPSQFDHVITAVHLGQERVIVDTTSEVAPFGALWGVIRHKDAVLVTPAGKSEIVTTPAEWPMPAMQRIEVDGKISDLGRLERSVKYTARGDLELALRSLLRRVPQPNWPELIQRITFLDGMTGDVKDIKTSDISDTRGPFELSFTMVTPNFVDFTSKKSKFSVPLPLIRLPELDADDTDPAELGGMGTVDLELHITVPEKYKLTVPVPVTMKREYAEYQSSYQLEKGVLSVSRKLHVLAPEVRPVQAANLDAFRNVVTRDAGQEIGVEIDEVAASAATKGADEDELYDAAVAAYRNRNYKLSAQLYEKVLELNPKHKTAWTYLGQAYMEQAQFDKAENAFKKQVEINPYDEVVYNDLGLLYERMHKYDDASAQYRKQIEVNPLDQYAHRNLGLMLARRHKYEEAIPDLEQALSIAGEDVFVQQQLGDAYLKTGKTDKAIETFDKVVKASPTPLMWNNVAYALAEEKQSLDRARKYAESAVAMTVATLNNLPMDQLIEQGAGLTNALASYWDTLGWVYFQEGNLDEAEKYVRASWEIAQGGEVGDHLAQIYEKRGMKDHAIEMYAESMATIGPVPETRGRLAALVGEKKVDALVNSKRSKLGEERSVPLGKGTQDGFAEFHIVLRGPAVENVAFAKGSASLKDFIDKLKGLKYPTLNSDKDTRLYRRGIVSCSKVTTRCDLVLVPANVAFDGATDVPKEIQGLFDSVSEQK
jgi:tetratricopeptide (TPR) repeat protein/transglutaminase-like putative cysteine protease